MRVPGKKFIAHSLKRFRRRFVSHGLILGYHRISSGLPDPFGLNVSPQHFEEHLQVLKRCGRPVTVQSLVGSLDGKRGSDGQIAMTFDDGYRDYMTEALPRMARFDIPSTIFVATGALGGEFWWDRLAGLAGSKAGAAAIAAGLEKSNGASGDRSVTGEETTDSLVHRAYSYLLNMSRSGRSEWLDEAARTAKCQHGVQPACEVLSMNDIAELACHELVDVGCHTVTHPRLATQDAQSQSEEMLGCKRLLERVIDREVALLSYPNGSRSSETLRIAEESGFRFACASHADVVWRGSNLFDLPRLWAPDCDGDTFGKWLRRWL